MAKHANDGKCAKCAELFNKYPNFNAELRAWFEALQKESTDAHISCAGRGKADQEAAFKSGASKAHFGQSSHNYNCAIDVFQLKDGAAVWNKAWFAKVVAPKINSRLNWYGKPGSAFFELPHIELANWKALRDKKEVSIVEPI